MGKKVKLSTKLRTLMSFYWEKSFLILFYQLIYDNGTLVVWTRLD